MEDGVDVKAVQSELATEEPELIKIFNGWMAKGDGWAVTADTEEGALVAVRAAELKHAEIIARPIPR